MPRHHVARRQAEAQHRGPSGATGGIRRGSAAVRGWLIWILYGFYMDFIWILYGFYLDFIWILSGFYMDFIWILSGFYMDFIWIL